MHSDVEPLEEKSPLLNQIYCSILVKCKHHVIGCTWSGSAPAYEFHRDSCSHKDEQNALRQEVIYWLEKGNEESQRLEAQNKILEGKTQRLEMQKKIPMEEIKRLEMQNKTSKEEIQRLETQNKTIFHFSVFFSSFSFF